MIGRALVVTVLATVLTGSTGYAWVWSADGTGLSDDLHQSVSVRSESARSGRMFVGGGLRSGK